MSFSPCGFTRTPEQGLARLLWRDGAWTVDGREEPGEAGLRALRGIQVIWPGEEVPLDGVMRLAAAGVPLTADSSPAWVPADLGVLLTDHDWLAYEPVGTARCLADLRREEHSIQLRRLAAPRPPADPLVSVVMATKRPEFVASALGQMARQRGVRAEVVLGLHGIAFEQVREAVESCPLPVEWVEADEEVPFGEVLNRAAALAGGDYLTKWDDDDWYGPGHLSDLLMAVAYTGADVVGVAGEFFYLEPLHLTIRRTTFASGAAYRSEVWTDHVAGGTILLSREKFREIGGFPAVRAAVDREFLKAATGAGARVYRTHGLGYVLRRGLSEQHTWRLPLAHFVKVAANQWHGFRPSRLMEAA